MLSVAAYRGRPSRPCAVCFRRSRLANYVRAANCSDPGAVTAGFHEPSLVFLAGTDINHGDRLERRRISSIGGPCRFALHRQPPGALVRAARRRDRPALRAGPAHRRLQHQWRRGRSPSRPIARSARHDGIRRGARAGRWAPSWRAPPTIVENVRGGLAVAGAPAAAASGRDHRSGMAALRRARRSSPSARWRCRWSSSTRRSARIRRQAAALAGRHRSTRSPISAAPAGSWCRSACS